MSESANRSKWSEGVSLEGIPYEDQPKVIVTVSTYNTVNGMDRGNSTAHDITDWLQANIPEQIRILDRIEELLDGSTDLDDLDLDEVLEDNQSGDSLLGPGGPDLPRGDAGTDVYLLSAYIRYLKECRDRNFIPFSDEKGHADRARNARHAALNDAHEEIFSAVGRYTVLAQANAAAAEQRDGQPEQRKTLGEKTRALVALIRPKKKADAL